MKILQNGNFSLDLDKYSMAVPVRPEMKQKLQDAGINLIDNTELISTLDTPMPGASGVKREIKKILGHGIDLPRVMFSTKKLVVQLDGKQYYILGIKEPTKRDYPNGILWLLDLENGDVIQNDFLPYADRLEAIGRNLSQEDTNAINAKIKKWNDKVNKLQYSENPSTWALQIKSLEDTIDDRLSTIDSMLASEEKQKQETPWENYNVIFDEIKNELETDIRNGVITSEADIIDSMLFLYFGDRKSFVEEAMNAVEQGNNFGSLTLDMVDKIKQLLTVRNEAVSKAKIKEQELIEERKQRVEDLLGPEAKQPTYAPFSLVDLRSKSPIPHKYFSPETKRQQIHEIIKSLNSDKELLSRVKSSFTNMREFIAGLEKGERAEDLLISTERGAFIRSVIETFLNNAKEFLAKYVVEIFREKKVDGAPTGMLELNPSLVGYSGGTGNGEVAVHLNQIYALLARALKNYKQKENIIS